MSKTRELFHRLYRLADRLMPQTYAKYSRSPIYRREWRKRLVSAALDRNHTPWHPLKKPLSDCNVALLTTAGVHLSSQTPHSPLGNDPSWRAIPAAAERADLRVFHPAVNNADANRDPNIVFPLEHLRELQSEGIIGQVAPTHYSLWGCCTISDRSCRTPHLRWLQNSSPIRLTLYCYSPPDRLARRPWVFWREKLSRRGSPLSAFH